MGCQVAAWRRSNTPKNFLCCNTVQDRGALPLTAHLLLSRGRALSSTNNIVSGGNKWCSLHHKKPQTGHNINASRQKRWMIHIHKVSSCRDIRWTTDGILVICVYGTDAHEFCGIIKMRKVDLWIYGFSFNELVALQGKRFWDIRSLLSRRPVNPTCVFMPAHKSFVSTTIAMRKEAPWNKSDTAGVPFYFPPATCCRIFMC